MALTLLHSERKLYTIVLRGSRLYDKIYEVGKLYVVDDLEFDRYKIEILYGMNPATKALEARRSFRTLRPFVWSSICMSSGHYGSGTMVSRFGVLNIGFLPPSGART